MKKSITKKVVEKTAEAPIEVPQKTQKEMLLELYNTLNALGIRSISDLENMIANCKN